MDAVPSDLSPLLVQSGVGAPLALLQLSVRYSWSNLCKDMIMEEGQRLAALQMCYCFSINSALLRMGMSSGSGAEGSSFSDLWDMGFGAINSWCLVAIISVYVLGCVAGLFS